MAKRKLPSLKVNKSVVAAPKTGATKRRPLSLRNAIEDAILASPAAAGRTSLPVLGDNEFAPIVARQPEVAVGNLSPSGQDGIVAGSAAKPAMPADLRAEDFDFQSAEIWDVYQKALIAQRRGDLDSARKGYLTVLSRKPGDFDVMHMLGVLETQARNYPMAFKLLSDAMRIDDGGPAIHNNLAIVLCATGRHAEGMVAFRRALEIDPEFADAYANIGRALCDTGKAAESLSYFARACELEPKSAEIHFQRATVLDGLKLREEALVAYEQVLKINPSFAEAHCKRGHLYAQQKRFDDALISYERAIGCNPQYAEAHCNRGNVLRLTGYFAEGLVAVDRALALQRDVAPAHRIRGVILLALQRNEEALAAFDEAIRLRAGYLDALNDRGSALRALSRYDEAIAAHNQALALVPNASGVLANRGVAYLDSYRVEEGFRDLHRAVELAPQSAEFWNLHGNALQALNRHEEALLSYGRSLQLQPGFAQPEFNISMCRLVRGDFRGGWPPYERRWETGQKLGWMQFRRPMWAGQPFDGRLLAWGEQGVGDQIFHLSMLDSLRERAPNLLVALAPRLLALAQRSFPDLDLVPILHASRRPFDLQIPLGSIGRYLRLSWEDFPVNRMAYLKADEARTQALRERLRAKHPVVVGLSWLSRAERFGEFKSMTLRQLKPLLEIPGIQFVDLQYGETLAERREIRDTLGVDILRLRDVDPFNDLDGLAALLTACDFVVSSSSTTVHLAGALGVPVDLMLPYSSGRHWYWHEDRDDSPWYPSIRLYRQKVPAQWDEVVARVCEQVRNVRLPSLRQDRG